MFCGKCGAQLNDNAAACPTCGTRAISDKAVPNHLVPAILTTIFCCQITGLCAIIYACKVDTALAAGDIARARANSTIARNWIIAGLCVGLAVILYGIIVNLAL